MATVEAIGIMQERALAKLEKATGELTTLLIIPPLGELPQDRDLNYRYAEQLEFIADYFVQVVSGVKALAVELDAQLAATNAAAYQSGIAQEAEPEQEIVSEPSVPSTKGKGVK